MKLVFISREEYAQKDSLPFLERINKEYPQYFIIPEGGANEAGRKGMQAMMNHIPNTFDYVLLSVGSGTTFAGLRNVLPAHQHLLGFAPMKGGKYLTEEIKSHIQSTQDVHWEITDRFHFRGFGKTTNELNNFMQEFTKQYGFELDRVYTAKMMFGLRQMLSEKAFPSQAKILCIHTGGLTGN